MKRTDPDEPVLYFGVGCERRADPTAAEIDRRQELTRDTITRLIQADARPSGPARLEDPDSIRRFLPTLVDAVGMRAHGPLPSSNDGRSPDPPRKDAPCDSLAPRTEV